MKDGRDLEKMKGLSLRAEAMELRARNAKQKGMPPQGNDKEKRLEGDEVCVGRALEKREVGEMHNRGLTSDSENRREETRVTLVVIVVVFESNNNSRTLTSPASGYIKTAVDKTEVQVVDGRFERVLGVRKC